MIWQMFIVPVSGVMKLWFVLLHSVLGMTAPHAWVGSIFGLIITVRGLIAPLSYLQYRNTRVMSNLQPRLRELRDNSRFSVDPDADAEFQKAQKALYKEHNYSTAKGCFPALIQLPAFLGLYRVLILMARPTDGLDTTNHQPIGFLTGDDVGQFLSTRIMGVPVPAYVSMSDEQFAHLQTSHDEVAGFVLPFLVLAATFTTVNMAYSVWRSYTTLDHESKLSVFMVRMLAVFVVLVPFMIINFGLHGPAPAALCLYYFVNNLWTMTQYIVLQTYLDKKLPFTDDFRAVREEGKQRSKNKRALKKAFLRRRRGRRLRMALTPWRAGELHRDNKRDKQKLTRDLDPEAFQAKQIKTLRAPLTKEKNRKLRVLKAHRTHAERKGLPWPPEEIKQRWGLTDEGDFPDGYFDPPEHFHQIVDRIRKGELLDDIFAEQAQLRRVLNRKAVVGDEDPLEKDVTTDGYEMLGGLPVYPTMWLPADSDDDGDSDGTADEPAAEDGDAGDTEVSADSAGDLSAGTGGPGRGSGTGS
ncbi:membrane protein insertase YidC [Corynebacterium mendelii]|uniref:Membrane protein insertase YidC n=1 Tax=Corynebacterium mendelii TaxID=2765362 RepID=A0A939IYA6_9CORY|nr:membrane protein insertase YidC [Corynebacterium mendelii]MBN9645335.1 membrane protein insertase YidC [Corynebacterium mendelii]